MGNPKNVEHEDEDEAMGEQRDCQRKGSFQDESKKFLASVQKQMQAKKEKSEKYVTAILQVTYFVLSDKIYSFPDKI